MLSLSWPGLRANCERRQCGGDVDSLGDKQLDHALVLSVKDLVINQLCFPPGARRVDHLDEWDGTLPVGTEGNAPSLVGAREVALAPCSTGEHTRAICQEPRGFGGPHDLCATHALLGRKLESGRVAFRRGACNCAPVLIEQRERQADSRDQGSRP